MKRLFDCCVSFVLLVLFSPLLLLVLGAVWLGDFHSPFFRSWRVGLGGKAFGMFKIRTMFWDSDQTVSITSQNDQRIMPVGHLIRSLKIDEIPQLWNVFWGDMSLVGPRPDVYEGGVSLYTPEEQMILTVKPGMVDLASIVFSNEGQLLESFQNLKEGYYKEIFPLKKRLMLFYAQRRDFWLDLWILWATVCLFFSYKKALKSVTAILVSYKSPPFLVQEVQKFQNFSYPY